MDTTKILTVRDSEGRIIQDAKSVEVWKTKENKIRSLDVLESVSKSQITTLNWKMIPALQLYIQILKEDKVTGMKKASKY